MVKSRSPGYPSISLGEAIEKITLVYKNDYQNKIPRIVVANHAGYKSMNGRALSVLASLAKFGLLDGRGEESWVSDLALQIIAHPHKSTERAVAIAEAAESPALFSEISARFPGGVSEVALRSYLLTRKFIPQAAEIVARCYRETKQFVLDEAGPNDTLEITNEEPVAMRGAFTQAIENTGIFSEAVHARGNIRQISATIRPSSSIGNTGNLVLNEPRVAIEGNTMHIEALVNSRGLKRLRKIIEANAPLLDDDDEEEDGLKDFL